MSQGRWNRSISHIGEAANDFISEFFAEPDRRVFLIAGAGFDPRSTVLPELLKSSCKKPIGGLLVREQRPSPDPTLEAAANTNEERLREIVEDAQVVQLDIFSADNAVVGGSKIARKVANLDFAGFTDIVVDVSALSLGISFPTIGVLFKKFGANAKLNLHAMVVAEPNTDGEIEATAGDTVSTVHGFKGGFGLDENKNAAKLWLPLLFRKRQSVLDKIHSFVKPDETCPILPFPSGNPRLPDELFQYYGESFESRWEVDPRNVVYADERKPLDVYRNILRIDDARKQVFEEVCGAMTVLTPIGSKVLAIGAMLAAIEREFPVIYIESVDYNVDLGKLMQSRQVSGDLVHVWISGEAYATIGDTEGIVS